MFPNFSSIRTSRLVNSRRGVCLRWGRNFLSALLVGVTGMLSLEQTGCVSEAPPPPPPRITTYELPPSPPLLGLTGVIKMRFPESRQASSFDPQKFPTIPFVCEIVAAPLSDTANRMDKSTLRPNTLAMEGAVKFALLERGFRVLDRSNVTMKGILEEIKFQESGITREAAARLGNALGTKCLLVVKWITDDTPLVVPDWLLFHDGNGNFREVESQVITRKSSKVSAELLDINALETIWVARGESLEEVISQIPFKDKRKIPQVSSPQSMGQLEAKTRIGFVPNGKPADVPYASYTSLPVPKFPIAKSSGDVNRSKYSKIALIVEPAFEANDTKSDFDRNSPLWKEILANVEIEAKLALLDSGFTILDRTNTAKAMGEINFNDLSKERKAKLGEADGANCIFHVKVSVKKKIFSPQPTQPRKRNVKATPAIAYEGFASTVSADFLDLNSMETLWTCQYSFPFPAEIVNPSENEKSTYRNDQKPNTTQVGSSEIAANSVFSALRSNFSSR